MQRTEKQQCPGTEGDVEGFTEGFVTGTFTFSEFKSGGVERVAEAGVRDLFSTGKRYETDAITGTATIACSAADEIHAKRTVEEHDVHAIYIAFEDGEIPETVIQLFPGGSEDDDAGHASVAQQHERFFEIGIILTGQMKEFYPPLAQGLLHIIPDRIEITYDGIRQNAEFMHGIGATICTDNGIRPAGKLPHHIWCGELAIADEKGVLVIGMRHHVRG